MSKHKDLIKEEINKYVESFNLKDSKAVTKVLKELFTLKTDNLINNIGSVESDSKSALGSDMWDWFIETITNSIDSDKEEWLKALRDTKVTILVYKYFSKNNQIDIDNVESFVRTNIKPYFTALQNCVDSDDFKSKFFNLPTEILHPVVRYLFKISPDFKKSIVVTNNKLGGRIKELIKERMKFVKNIDEISQGYRTTLDIHKAKELFDNGLFFEDNMLNRGINEYFVKLLNHEVAAKKLKDVFPSAQLRAMKKQIESCAAYVAHVSSLKLEQTQPYFTTDGQQVGKRFSNDLEVVTDQQFDGYVVDKDSRLKEPSAAVNPVSNDWQASAPGAGGAEGPGASGGPGGMGGGSFGGGGGDFDVPSGGEDFAAPGEEGKIPGEPDGEDMPTDDSGFPVNFGSKETNDDDKPADILPTVDTPKTQDTVDTPTADDKPKDAKK